MSVVNSPARSAAASPRLAPYRAVAWLAAAVGVDVAVDPSHTHIPLCPFHSLTGMWCPLCGGLRAVYQLAHLQVRAALHDNALFVASLPVLAYMWVSWAVRARSGTARQRWPRAATVALVALTVAFWVVRNLPFASWLRPPSG